METMEGMKDIIFITVVQSADGASLITIRIQLENELAKEIELQKVGHWNTYETIHGGIKEEWLQCSECRWSSSLYIPRNYCPKCGAKMESEE